LDCLCFNRDGRWSHWFWDAQTTNRIEQAKELVRQLEARAVTIEHVPGDDAICYSTGNGWRIGVFDDAGQWDYFEYFVTPDGYRVDIDDYFEDPILGSYQPPNEDLEALWSWSNRQYRKRSS
jgi:hypothetical protein